MSAAFSPFRTNSPLTVVKLADGEPNSPLLEKHSVLFAAFKTLNGEHFNLISPLPRANSHYFKVRHLKELLVFSIQEDDAAPVYGHNERTGIQGRSCNTDVSKATVG